MPRHTLFAYVNGSDLDDIADALEARLRAFVEGRRWVAGEAWGVNQQAGDRRELHGARRHPLLGSGAQPALARMLLRCGGDCAFLGNLHGEFGRDFVVGISEAQTGIAETCIALPTARLTWKCWRE